MESMICKICEKKIERYDPAFNSLKIDDTQSADICLDCIHKIISWQGGIIAKLFPTKTMKKRFSNQ